MSLPKRLSAYIVEQGVLDAVLEANKSMTYELDSYNQAVAFRQRAYYFRKLAAEQREFKYDQLRIDFVTPKGRSLRIDFIKIKGTLRDDAGQDVKVDVPVPQPDLKVAAIARNLDDWIKELETGDKIDLSLLEESDDISGQPGSEGSTEEPPEGGEGGGTPKRKSGDT